MTASVRPFVAVKIDVKIRTNAYWVKSYIMIFAITISNACRGVAIPRIINALILCSATRSVKETMIVNIHQHAAVRGSARTRVYVNKGVNLMETLVTKIVNVLVMRLMTIIRVQSLCVSMEDVEIKA